MTLSWAFAAAMVLTTVAHLGRLVTPWRSRRTFDVDLAGAAMGVGMAIMLVGPLTPSASRRWALLFAVPALWFIVRVLDAYFTDGAVSQHFRQALVRRDCGRLVDGRDVHGRHVCGQPGRPHPGPADHVRAARVDRWCGVGLLPHVRPPQTSGAKHDVSAGRRCGLRAGDERHHGLHAGADVVVSR